MAIITSLSWSQKEWNRVKEIIMEEDIINRSDFFKNRILQKRRKAAIPVSAQDIDLAQVQNILSGTIDDYRKGKDIIEDLKEIQELIKKASEKK